MAKPSAAEEGPEWKSGKQTSICREEQGATTGGEQLSLADSLRGPVPRVEVGADQTGLWDLLHAGVEGARYHFSSSLA